MQEKNHIFIVKTDLLLEKDEEVKNAIRTDLTFELLTPTNVNIFHEIDYILENDEITTIHNLKFFRFIPNLYFLYKKIKSGYIITNYENLQKLLSLYAKKVATF